jgi:hypothetical protein
MYVLLAAFAATPLALGAQSSCAAGTAAQLATQDACQKAIDLFHYMAPQIGTVIAGGNATLGQGSALGGFATFPFPHPKVSIGVRMNALAGSLPDVGSINPSVTGRDNTTAIPVESQVLVGPAADVAIGLFKGLPLGVTNFGGIDLLISAMYLPEFDKSNVSLDLPDGGLKIGYGARLGLIQESLVTPGVAVTFLRRDLPTANLTGSSGSAVAGADLSVNELEVNTASWRVVASKSLVMFGIAAGAGQDNYESSAEVVGSAGAFASDVMSVAQKINRTNYFLDLSMNLPFLKFVGEVGMVQGGTIETFNTWDGKQPDDKRFYGSVGARLSF